MNKNNEIKIDLVKVVIFLRPILKKIRLYNFFYKKAMEKKEGKFVYSESWYNTTYHDGRLDLKNNEFDKINDRYEKAGYRKRLENALDAANLKNEEMFWLEVGCHMGLTSYWIVKKFDKARVYMFDFSSEAINWCKKTFPFKEKAVIWQASIENIKYQEEDLSNKFDVITCIDVTEHLPNDLYKAGIKEMFRVLKPGGALILMQGNTKENPEHINVLPEKELLKNFLDCGFKLSQYLPERHYKLTK